MGMETIILLVIAFLFAVLAGFFISTLIELKRTAAQVTRFLGATEAPLNSALSELEQAARSLRGVTDSVGAVTDDVRLVSSSVSELAGHISGTAQSIRKISDSLSGRTLALQAGVRAAVEVLLGRLFAKSRDSHTKGGGE